MQVELLQSPLLLTLTGFRMGAVKSVQMFACESDESLQRPKSDRSIAPADSQSSLPQKPIQTNPNCADEDNRAMRDEIAKLHAEMLELKQSTDREIMSL